MKFIKCHLSTQLDNQGTVIVDDSTEIEKDYDSVMNEVRKGTKFSGYLFYPGDKPGVGLPVDPKVSMEDYLKDPSRYGVCIYKTYNGTICIE